jgi:SNW domain-containing protein 1
VEEVEATRQRTQAALEKLVSGAVAAQKPKNIQGLKRDAPTYVRFQPSAQMGDTKQPKERIIKIVQRQMDPLEPPKHKHKKIPRGMDTLFFPYCQNMIATLMQTVSANNCLGPPSPPPPVLHSPPRKLTAADQEAWRVSDNHRFTFN